MGSQPNVKRPYKKTCNRAPANLIRSANSIPLRHRQMPAWMQQMPRPNAIDIAAAPLVPSPTARLTLNPSPGFPSLNLADPSGNNCPLNSKNLAKAHEI
jgi:hypothetical protein